MQITETAGDQQSKKTGIIIPIKAYIYSYYGTLTKPNRKLQYFKTLEEALAKFESIKPKYVGKQIVFIDYSVFPSKIIHILNQ